jgi:serine/threonine-protein kinase
LARFAGGTLSRPDAEDLEVHLDGCAECRELVAAVASGDSHPGDTSSAPTQLETGAPTQPGSGEAPALRPGDTLGRYAVREWLGAGGMGVVYAAEDPTLGRRVALKLLRREASGEAGEAARARLLREAQAMARLSHPNVLPVFDLGTTADGQVFLAMEWVRGPTLAGWLRERERPWREVLALFVAAGRGLAAAHRAGLVHRDFKPANVLVGEDGRPRVTDFGLVREAHAAGDAHAEPSGASQDTALTRAGTVAGTPAYMAPEQHAGAGVDARADQFSFCVALSEALHGERPFAEDASGEARWRPRRAPTSRRLPSHVREALARGLARKPEARFASMDALLAALERPAASRWRALGVAVALGVVASGLAVWRGRQAEPVEVAATRSQLLELKVGERRVLRVPGLTRLALGEVGVAEARARPPDEVTLHALAPGATHLLVWSADGTRWDYTLSITLP